MAQLTQPDAQQVAFYKACRKRLSKLPPITEAQANKLELDGKMVEAINFVIAVAGGRKMRRALNIAALQLNDKETDVLPFSYDPNLKTLILRATTYKPTNLRKWLAPVYQPDEMLLLFGSIVYAMAGGE